MYVANSPSLVESPKVLWIYFKSHKEDKLLIDVYRSKIILTYIVWKKYVYSCLYGKIIQ